MTKINKKRKGFTLIELLTVIAILSFLTSIVLSSLSIAKTKAENAKYTSEMINLRTALYINRADTGILLGSVSPSIAIDALGANSATFEAKLISLVSLGYIPSIPHYSNWPVGSDTGFTFQYSEYKVNTPTDAVVCGNQNVADAVEAQEKQEASLLLHTSNPEVEMLGIAPGVRECDGSSCDPITGTSSDTPRIYCLPV